MWQLINQILTGLFMLLLGSILSPIAAAMWKMWTGGPSGSIGSPLRDIWGNPTGTLFKLALGLTGIVFITLVFTLPQARREIDNTSSNVKSLGSQLQETRNGLQNIEAKLDKVLTEIQASTGR